MMVLKGGDIINNLPINEYHYYFNNGKLIDKANFWVMMHQRTRRLNLDFFREFTNMKNVQNDTYRLTTLDGKTIYDKLSLNSLYLTVHDMYFTEVNPINEDI